MQHFKQLVFLKKNALKLWAVRKYLLALLWMTSRMSSHGWILYPQWQEILRCPSGKVCTLWLCFGPAISCHWIILGLGLGSAQPHLFAASVGSTSVTNNPFAASCDDFCESPCLKVQPVQSEWLCSLPLDLPWMKINPMVNFSTRKMAKF